MTSDKYILDIVKNGLSLTLSNIEASRKPKILETKIQKLLKKVVIETEIKTGDYFSNLFTRKKRMERIERF